MWSNPAGVHLRAIAVLCCLALVLLVVPAVQADAEEAAIYTFTITYNIQNNSSNTALNVQTRIFLFDNLSGWADQQVLSETITVDGQAVSPTITDEADNRWTLISLEDIGAGSSKTIVVTQTIKVESVKFSINPSLVGTSIPSDLSEYTQPVASLWESTDNGILTLATSLTENTSNLYYMARQLFDWIVDNITYERQTSEHDALWSFQTKKGDCSDFTNLYISMARAAGIPTKAVSGNAYLSIYSLGGAQSNIDSVGHAWILIYLPNYGWIPADGVWPQGQGSFGEADYSHIAGATTGGEGVVRPSGIIWPGPGQISNSWSYYQGSPVSSQDIANTTSGNVAPEALLDVSIQAGSQITEDVLPFTVTVKNMGQNSVSDISATLDLDSQYFEPVTAQTKSSLAVGETWNASFNVTLNENAYGMSHDIQSTATYTSSYSGATGQLEAVGTRSVAVAAKPESPVVPQDLMLYVLVGVAVGAAIAVVAAVARR